MSYDVSLVDRDGRKVGSLDRNYTYNVACMFQEAVGSTPNDWSGMAAKEVALLCEKIAVEFITFPTKYAGMNPANGWGDSIGARGFILDIMDACRANPDAILEVC